MTLLFLGTPQSGPKVANMRFPVLLPSKGGRWSFLSTIAIPPPTLTHSLYLRRKRTGEHKWRRYWRADVFWVLVT